ncbi:hypothetical protein DMENIID0001_018750 [Sergentomyia squamirostris]
MRSRSFYLAALYSTIIIFLAILRHTGSADVATRNHHDSPEVIDRKPHAAVDDFSLLIDVTCHKMERPCRNSTKFASRRSRNDEFSLRFMDEIAGEIDIIEDKKDSIFSRDRLKKLFIPMLIILKLFKLKLLLLLPFLFGLASFKKIIGFLIIIIPAVLGFLKLQSLQQASYMEQQAGGLPTQYSPQGIGSLSYYPYHPQFNRKSDILPAEDYQPRRPAFRTEVNSTSGHRYPDSYLAVVGNRVPSARSQFTR